MYKKRPGTSGIRGQLYETKLISLLLYRARHNDDIEDINIASNVDGIGVFDDICFRAKIRGYDRPMAVFIQAKHRENNKALILDNANDLAKYFDSYLKIRRAFRLNNENVLFDGEFEGTGCLFVLYTTAKGDQNKNIPEVRFASNLNDLIGTDGTIGYRPSYNNESVENLYKLAIKEQMNLLAITMAKFICNKADNDDFEMLLNDELVLRYHVILAQKVMLISDIQPEGHRIATFREEFFNSEEEFITSFKERFLKEVLKERELNFYSVCIDLECCFDDIPSPDILCDLIGTVVTYKHGKLEFIDETISEELKRKLKEVDVCQFTVDTAINLAGKKMLSSRSFKVPTAFGNKDLTIKRSEAKIENRLNYLTSQICHLLEKPHPNNKVTIDETLGKGLLRVNGGLAGAVGNILVLDKNSELMKFTDNCELLGKLSNRLFTKLKGKIQDLHEYRFEVKVKNFPKLSFECGEYDKNMVKDFMNKLIFYTNQADENRVEEILKNEIEKHQCNNASNFRVRSDAIFLTYHDEIQKWWKSPKEELLLTKHTINHETTISKIVQQPLLHVMDVIYRNKLNHNIIDFKFSEEALTFLKFDVPFLNTMIITDTIALTSAKVFQNLKNKDYFVLDLEYLLNLPDSDCNELCAELMNTSKNKILIFVCNNILSSQNLSKKFDNIAKAIFKKMTIIITNQVSVEMIKKHFPQISDLVNDEKNNLTNMSTESRKTILNNSKVIFQDEPISLDLIIDEKSMAIIEGDVLNSVVSKKTIILGKSLGNSNYEEIKHLYIKRHVRYSDSIKYDAYKLNIRTLNDIPDNVVLIIAKPGMGKSTLLTHLSLETKKLNPSIWIIRINLLEYAREFSNWKQNETKIDMLESLNFMCNFVVSEKHGKVNKLTIELEESNGIVSLKDCSDDQWTAFELKMFLHFYNRGQIIFLFDGFDEICPHYTIEVMEFLKSVRRYPRKHKMWITSRSYNQIKSILQQEFGKSYEILNFGTVERGKFTYKFWKSNLVLKEFNKEQLDNVYNFIKFMSERIQSVGNFGSVVKLPNLLLQELYFNVFNYLRFELKHTYIPLWTFETKFEDDTYSKTITARRRMQYNGNTSEFFYMDQFFGTPLHLYLLVNYFQAEVKDVSKKSNKWNLDVNTLTIYDRFLETKLKKIRFQEKNKMDIYNPDILITYEKERADFISKHKQIAAYAVFHKGNNLLFTRKQLKEIKNMIKLIKRGEEKTGLIYSVTSNNLPIFIHRSFAEYLAVEYFCDLLKKEKCSEKQKAMMDFIFNVMFFEMLANVRNILDSKIKVDKTLMSVLQKNGKVIFDLLMEQTKAFGSTNVQNDFIEIKYESSLKLALSDNLNNFVFFFISIFKSHLTKDNLDNFIKIIKETNLFDAAIRVNCEEFIRFSLEIVRNIDESKFRNLFSSHNFPFFVNLSSKSNEEILDILREFVFLTTQTTTS